VRRLDEHDPAALAAAADVLAGGGLLVVPTDTVYGMAARPDRPDAVEGIYRAKGRPSGMPLPVLAASLDQVRALGVAMTPAGHALAARWWPGPLTLVFGFSPVTPRPAWLDDRDEVAVRLPRHHFLQALLEITGVLLVTSANRHGSPTPASAAAAAAEVGSAGLVIDGGVLTDTPSTLVNLHGGTPVVERVGAISADEVAQCVAAVP